MRQRILATALLLAVALTSSASANNCKNWYPRISLRLLIGGMLVLGSGAGMYVRYRNWTDEEREKAERLMDQLVENNDIEGVKRALWFKPVNSVLQGPSFNAVERNQTEIALMLIEAGAKGTGWGTDRLMIEAIENGNLKIVKALVENGHPIDYQSGRALIDSIEGKHEDIYNYLIDKGAKVDFQNGRILREAYDIGDLKLMKRALDMGVNPVGVLRMAPRGSEAHKLLLEYTKDVPADRLGEFIKYSDDLSYASDLLSKVDLDAAKKSDAVADSLMYAVLQKDVLGLYFNRVRPPDALGMQQMNSHFADLKARKLDIALSMARLKKHKDAIELLKKLGADQEASEKLDSRIEEAMNRAIKAGTLN